MIVIALVAMGMCVGAVLLLVAVFVEKSVGWKWQVVGSLRRFRLAVELAAIAAAAGVVAIPSLVTNHASIGYLGPLAAEGPHAGISLIAMGSKDTRDTDPLVTALLEASTMIPAADDPIVDPWVHSQWTFVADGSRT